jgi:outer membrane protein assembly factor BamB
VSVPFRGVVLALSLTLVSACSTINTTLDTLNPFSSSAPKIKPAELAPFAGTASLHHLWQGSVGASAEFAFTPAVVGSAVFAAARDGTLVRFEEGRPAWRINAGQALSAGVGASDQLVVVGTAKGDVLAFHAADGRPAWQARASSEILAAPALEGDLVVVRSGDARIFAFEAANGKRRWMYQRSSTALVLRSNVGVTLTDQAVYAGFAGGKLVAVARHNGAALWEATVALPRGTTELERITDVASDPVVAGSAVCAVAYQGRVACFDVATGSLQWAREVSSTSGLALSERHVFVSDEKGAVHAFDRRNGASLWKQDKLFMRHLTRPIVLGQQLAVADYQGVVHLLRAEDGAFAARLATDGTPIIAAPQRYAAGFIVQTKNGALHALGIQ